MTYFAIIILAFALSVDACVVSFSYGLVFNNNKLKNALLLAAFTGIFQGIMPIIGYFLTSIVKTQIQPYSKFIVFLIFSYLGIKFVVEAFAEHKKEKLCISLKCLLIIGVATSIDAFSAGISLALFGNKIFKPAFLIFFVTFINSILGYFTGTRLKAAPTRFLEVLAGTLLLFLGIKALFL